MIPYEVDPSLHSGDPAPPLLEDGFSPPLVREPAPAGAERQDDENAPLSTQADSRSCHGDPSR